LMLAHSIVGHVKSYNSLKEVLEIGYPDLGLHSTVNAYGESIAKIQSKYKSDFALMEGPDERRQA